MRTLLCCVSAVLLAAGCATRGGAAGRSSATPPPGAVGTTATAEMKDAQGNPVGQVQLTQAPNGVILKVTLSGVPGGERAIHVHEVGQCEPPFKSAGGHFNPRGHQHGIQNPEGKHAGDLPNLHVPASGELQVELFTDAIHLGDGEGSVFDGDGSALIIHEGVDDYRSDPTGNAGDRYACGVIRKS
jgi:Cu-Zn family superoxide dismutase